jgi:hypothetical protein
MAQLQYAYLAEHARLDPQGTVSVLGGGFNRLQVPRVPSTVGLSVVGSFKFEQGDDVHAIRLTIVGPNESFRVSFDTEIDPAGPEAKEGAETYVTYVTFVANGLIPVPRAGAYQVLVQTEDGEPFRIPLLIIAPSDPSPITG